MENFIPFKDINIATVLTTLGCPLNIEGVLDVRTGVTKSYIYVDKKTIPRVKVKAEVGATVKFKLISSMLHNGKLAELHPKHEALDCVRAITNENKIKEWLRTGKPQRLCIADGVDRFLYDNTDLIVQASEQFPTKNIKLAAALACIGVPICKIVGTSEDFTLYLSRFANDGITDAYQIAKDLLNRSIDPEHPVKWAYQTLVNKEKVIQAVAVKAPDLLVKKKNSARQACAYISQTEDKQKMKKDLSLAASHCGIF